jgi:hypothetical protein
MRWLRSLLVSRGSRAIIAAGCAAAATYAVGDLVADVNGTVLSTLQGLAAYQDDPPVPPGTLLLTSHEPSVCCEPFIQGLELLVWTAFLGGVPLAVVALLTFRARGRTRTMLGRAVANAGFVLQLFSVCLWTMVFLGLVLFKSDVSVEFESGGWMVTAAVCAIWLTHTVIGVLGTAAWWRMADSDPGYTPLFAGQSTAELRR